MSRCTSASGRSRTRLIGKAGHEMDSDDHRRGVAAASGEAAPRVDAGGKALDGQYLPGRVWVGSVTTAIKNDRNRREDGFSIFEASRSIS